MVPVNFQQEASFSYEGTTNTITSVFTCQIAEIWHKLKFKGSLLRNSLSDEIETAKSLVVFKQKLYPEMAAIASSTSAETSY